MKYLMELLSKKTYLLLALFTFIAIMLHMRQIEFPHLNSDEASFGYNAFSILQTGRDEYGELLPTRFKAFGENKLPVTIYTIVPFIAIFGLNDISVRLPFILIGILSPILFFLLTKKITQNVNIALIAAFLVSISPWVQIMSRHIHENIIILALVIGMIWNLFELQKKVTLKKLLILSILVGIGLFTYHIGKMLAVYVAVWISGILLFMKGNRGFLKHAVLIFAIPIILFSITEILNPSSRVGNLFLTSNKGFVLSIEELRKGHDSRVIHNKITYATRILSNQYLSYFSPEFLVRKGDNNARFGFEGISPITPIEYIFIFIGLYFMFKNKEQSRYLIVSLFLLAPITAALSWQEYSLTRSFLLILPILIFVAYGIYHSAICIKKYIIRALYYLVIVGGILYFSLLSWDFYFNHYPKRIEAIYGWQGGYAQMGNYLKGNYDDFNRFYITKKLGQPYIFTLFYLQYPPGKYQEQATLTETDEYGFGQVERYGKFNFNFHEPDQNESAVFIGYPDEFPSSITESEVQKVTIENNDIFWIYEGQRNK